jgi:hypothetical protein
MGIAVAGENSSPTGTMPLRMRRILGAGGVEGLGGMSNPCSRRTWQPLQMSWLPMHCGQNKCSGDDISGVGFNHELRITHQTNTETTISPC